MIDAFHSHRQLDPGEIQKNMYSVKPGAIFDKNSKQSASPELVPKVRSRMI